MDGGRSRRLKNDASMRFYVFLLYSCLGARMKGIEVQMMIEPGFQPVTVPLQSEDQVETGTEARLKEISRRGIILTKLDHF